MFCCSNQVFDVLVLAHQRTGQIPMAAQRRQVVEIIQFDVGVSPTSEGKDTQV
jgi:hypothetical protein